MMLPSILNQDKLAQKYVLATDVINASNMTKHRFFKYIKRTTGNITKQNQLRQKLKILINLFMC